MQLITQIRQGFIVPSNKNNKSEMVEQYLGIYSSED